MSGAKKRHRRATLFPSGLYLITGTTIGTPEINTALDIYANFPDDARIAFIRYNKETVKK
jgi:hypothetical protein